MSSWPTSYEIKLLKASVGGFYMEISFQLFGQIPGIMIAKLSAEIFPLSTDRRSSRVAVLFPFILPGMNENPVCSPLACGSVTVSDLCPFKRGGMVCYSYVPRSSPGTKHLLRYFLSVSVDGHVGASLLRSFVHSALGGFSFSYC